MCTEVLLFGTRLQWREKNTILFGWNHAHEPVICRQKCSIISLFVKLFKIKRGNTFCIDSRPFFTESANRWRRRWCEHARTWMHHATMDVLVYVGAVGNMHLSIIHTAQPMFIQHKAILHIVERVALCECTASSRIVWLNESVLSGKMNCISFVVFHTYTFLLIAFHFKTQLHCIQSTLQHMRCVRVSALSIMSGFGISLGCDYIATNETINFQTLSCQSTFRMATSK